MCVCDGTNGIIHSTFPNFIFATQRNSALFVTLQHALHFIQKCFLFFFVSFHLDTRVFPSIDSISKCWARKKLLHSFARYGKMNSYSPGSGR